MRFVSLAVSFLACSLAAQKALPPTAPPTVPPIAPPVKVIPEDPSKYAAAAAKWFPVVEQTIDATLTDKEAKGVYRFKNPHNVPIVWRSLTGSCTCSQADIHVGDRKYELRSKTKQLFHIQGPAAEQAVVVDSIAVGPGEEGSVEIHVDTQQTKGNKAVSVDIHTTDTEMPMTRLQLKVNVPQAIQVSPADVAFGVVSNGETRPFRANVTSALKDFAIVSASPFPKGVTAKFERIENNGVPHWVIEGTFRQDNVGDVNLTLEFQTNVQVAPTVHLRLHASVRAPIEVKPSFFVVGRVQKGKTGSSKVTFTPADGKPLEAKAMHFENLNVPEKFVALRASKDGASLVVELEIAADAPPGLIKGDVVVDLDHAEVKQKRILFNAFVR